MQQLGPDQRWLIFPPGVWIMIVLTTRVALGLRYANFGRHTFAIGSNELTAWRCGISLRNTIMPIKFHRSAMPVCLSMRWGPYRDELAEST